MIKEFLLALQFLSIIPLEIKDATEKKLAKALIYFPAAGLLLGSILTGGNYFLIYLGFGAPVISIFLVICLIIITGGMHLDGLSDTMDAFSSGKGKEEMLNIMRDSHAGVMGILSIISVILLKISLLSSVNPSLIPVSLLLMCGLSRWSMVAAMYFFPYARKEGKAKIFIQGINLNILLLSTAMALASSVLIWGFKGLLAFAAAAACAQISGKIAKSKIGGITGDTLGATNELTEVTVLSVICLIGRGGSCII